MGNGGYADSQNPPSPYGKKDAGSPAQPSPAARVPEVKVLFWVLSSVGRKDVAQLVKSQIDLLRAIWKPKDDDLKKFEVNFIWDGTFKGIGDKDKRYRRIEIRRGGAPMALQLVKDNYSNAEFKPEIPVFVCEVAWDEDNEPGEPRDGFLRGYTLVKSLPWFTGERAIFLFASAAVSTSLAHEMTHWIGFSHIQYRDVPANVAANRGGVQVDRDEFRKLHRWATDVDFRKRLATK
jgi:hypothetical protein